MSLEANADSFEVLEKRIGEASGLGVKSEGCGIRRGAKCPHVLGSCAAPMKCSMLTSPPLFSEVSPGPDSPYGAYMGSAMRSRRQFRARVEGTGDSIIVVEMRPITVVEMRPCPLNP